MFVNPVTSHAATAQTSNNNSSSTNSNPLQDPNSMFMQLLTAQLENQSPLDPVGPTQFTSQLVEFNMLDQLSQINQTLQTAYPSTGTTSGSSTHSNAISGAH